MLQNTSIQSMYMYAYIIIPILYILSYKWLFGVVWGGFGLCDGS